MKLTQTIAIASATAGLLFAAGCAHEEHHAQYDESISPYANTSGNTSGRTSEYNQTTIYSSPSATSQSGSYSAGAGGASLSGGVATGEGGSMSQSDNTIVTDVRESLQQDPEIATIVPNIQITVNNGTLVLSGAVQSEEQKRQIESIARRSGKVVTINNQLQISSQSNGQRGTSGMGGGGFSNGENQSQGGQQGGMNQQGANQSGAGMGQTSRTNEGSSLYPSATNNMENQQNNPLLNPTSNSNDVNRIYPPGAQGSQSNNQSQGSESLKSTSGNGAGSQIYQNSNSSSNNGQLNATSSSNGLPRLYQNASNNVDNASSNALSPTSRSNAPNQIYQQNNQQQNNQQQNTQEQNTNTNNRMP